MQMNIPGNPGLVYMLEDRPSLPQATVLALQHVLTMFGASQILHDFRGTEKRRLRVSDLLGRFEEVRRADLLDETAAEMLRRTYV